MNSLTRRVDKLEEEKACGFYPEPMDNYDIADLERARQRVLAEFPDYVFCDEPLDPSLGFVERLECARQRTLQRIRQATAPASEARQ